MLPAVNAKLLIGKICHVDFSQLNLGVIKAENLFYKDRSCFFFRRLRLRFWSRIGSIFHMVMKLGLQSNIN